MRTALQPLAEAASGLLGLGRDIGEVDSSQMALRAIAIYVLALMLLRIGSKRFLS